MLKNALKAMLAAVLATTFVAAGAAAPVPAVPRACCGSSCPAPKAPEKKTCCLPAPSAPSASAERVNLPPVHLASAVLVSAPVAVSAAVPPSAAAAPRDGAPPGPTGLSPPAALPA